MQTNRLEKLLEFIKNEPEDPFLKYALATEYLRLNETDKALAFYEDLVKNHAGYTGTYYHLGKLYEALGRKQEAISIYETGMKITREKNDNHAFSELRAVYDELMDFDD
ncbi:tetratricopeptide repeat protein [Mucilaginibacter gotjawali]|uniref:Tetratricopeptide repeat protein n=2 Tax=Mucilaginibacter gotjawali TaxID=1550579 RepID=A0A0X8X271_9SPHI|nr:tetratricopeptide repeat protein [Mucilaginibacter gotjawali]MBB3054141.1 tetratricopeptide (TPR) repeat protein [Mucilaginibacter gotjawali]BAU54412.1 Tetratricopeptide repeat protein [Mucilaginibacter gotjawali]